MVPEAFKLVLLVVVIVLVYQYWINCQLPYNFFASVWISSFLSQLAKANWNGIMVYLYQYENEYPST